MRSRNKQIREQLRFIHILASFGLGVFIYSPWRSHPALLMAMSFGIFPLLGLTGLWMWKAPQINQWLTQIRSGSVNEIKM
ncbi:MAG: hypothetical protein F6K26_11925 [Moorea sp. SIO2I5]|nr:hypothetical protein [Moorena sp. SIO2I5]